MSRQHVSLTVAAEPPTRGLVSKLPMPMVEAHVWHPPPDLADLVDVFWVGRWDLPHGREHINELLGDPSMHVAFERCGDFVEGRVVGVWTSMWRRKLIARGYVRAAKLHPGCGTELWDVPAHLLSNRVTQLDSLVGLGAIGLRDRVLGAADDAEGLEPLMAWLRATRRSPRSPEAELIITMMAQLRSDPEIVQAQDLARRAGVGLRALQHLFRTHLGASPKWVIRRTRLQEVAARLDGGITVNLAQLAARLGYADQAHLTRDFKAATGKTPRQFMDRGRSK